MKYIHALLVGFALLVLTSLLAQGAEEEQSGAIGILAIVALVSVAIATVLAFMVALRMGGEMGNALKVIAVGLLGIDTLRELLGFAGYDQIGEYSEIIGSVIMLIGFYMLYKSTK